MTLQELIDWQGADIVNRSVKLEIKSSYSHKQEIVLWVHSFNLSGTSAGQYLKLEQPITDIDLDGLAEKREKAEYEKLKRKYGGAA